MGEAPPADALWRGLAPVHVLGLDLTPVNGYVIRTRGMVAAQIAAGAEPLVVVPPTVVARDPAGEEGPFAGRVRRVRHPAAQGEATVGASDLLEVSLCRLRSAVRRRSSRAAPGGDGVSAGGSASRLRPLARPLLDLEDRLAMRRLRHGLVDLAKSSRIDLLHAHSPFRSALPAIAAARRLGLPVVYEVRGLWEESAVADGLWQRGSRPYLAWRRRERQAMRRADAVIALGEALRTELVERGSPAARTFVVPNAVGEEVLEAANVVRSSPEEGPAGACTFGYVGSLRPLEGVEHLLHGVAASRRRGDDARVLVVGGGSDLPRLERLAAELGLGERATFTGAVPHPDVDTYYRRMDVVAITRPDVEVCRLVPPLKPLEAMAMGLPVVASDLPALREMVRPGVNGLLVPPEDADGFAAAVEPLYAPGFRRQLGGQGRKWVLAERTWRSVLAALASPYLAVSRSVDFRS